MNVFMSIATVHSFCMGISLNVYHKAKESGILFVSETNKTVTTLPFSSSHSVEKQWKGGNSAPII